MKIVTVLTRSGIGMRTSVYQVKEKNLEQFVKKVQSDENYIRHSIS